MARHLERKQDHAIAHGGNTFGQVERERGLSHRRAGRQDDQLSTLQPRHHVVHVVETSLESGQTPIAPPKGLDPAEGVLQDIRDVLEVGIH